MYNEEQVRNEMYLALDYYPTESSGHHSGVWWFRKRPDLIEVLHARHRLESGEYGYIITGARSA